MLSLSVLDQSVATKGQPQGEAIRRTLALASVCEQIGYSRFWVSEHHNSPTIVGCAPEILVSAIAATTTRIRIGSAGVMLPHYAPYKVAEQFRVLDAIAPGRIDLGLGRAPGSDGLTAYALNPLAAERPAQFPADVRDLLAWTTGAPLAEGHPFARVRAFPQGETAPDIWILGSSNYGAQVAAHFGLPYAFAWFFTDGRGAEEALHIYKSHFQPSARYPRPYAGLCVWSLVAESNEGACHHFASRARYRLLRDRGVFAPLESPEEALAHNYDEAERLRMEDHRRQNFIGAPEPVAERIASLAKRLDVQEMAVVTWAYDESARVNSYRLLAAAMGGLPD